jgi:hypothetical protein
MQHMVNGKTFELATERDSPVDSNALREAAGIPADRLLILQWPDGSTLLVNSGERVFLRPGEAVVNSPEHVRGGPASGAFSTPDTTIRPSLPR